jgi:hypothetical protein
LIHKPSQSADTLLWSNVAKSRRVCCYTIATL